MTDIENDSTTMEPPPAPLEAICEDDRPGNSFYARWYNDASSSMLSFFEEDVSSSLTVAPAATPRVIPKSKDADDRPRRSNSLFARCWKEISSEQSFFGALDAYTNRQIDFASSFVGFSTWDIAVKSSILKMTLLSLVLAFWDKYPWFTMAYHTNWSLVFTLVYSVLSLLLTTRMIPLLRDSEGGENGREQVASRWTRTTWMFYSLSVCSLVVNLFIWTTGDGWLKINRGVVYLIGQILAHGGILLAMIYDGLVANRIPIRLKHGWVFALYCVLYSVWCSIHSFLSLPNPYKEDDDSIYNGTLDVKEHTGLRLSILLLTLFIATPAILLLVWILSLYSFPFDFSGKSRRYVEMDDATEDETIEFESTDGESTEGDIVDVDLFDLNFDWDLFEV